MQYTYDGQNWRDGNGRAVTGPLAAQLNDRARAQLAGANYDEISKTQQYQDSFKKNGTGFGFGQEQNVNPGFGRGVLSGLGDVFLSASQGVHHGLSALGVESPAQRDYYDTLAKLRGQDISNAPGSEQVGRLAGDVAIPVPGFGEVQDASTLARLLQGAKMGAAGALYQPAEGDGSYLAQKASQSTLGALFGAPVNAALGKLVDQGVAARAPSIADVRLQAGDRQGMNLGYANVTDSPTLRMFSNISANLPGGKPLYSRAQQAVQSFEDRIGDATQQTGRTLERSDLGQALQDALSGDDGHVSRFQDQAKNDFNAVTRKVSPTTQVDLSNTLKAMNDTASAFPSNPALGAELSNSRLQRLASLISDDSGNPKPLFFNEAQRLRSEIGGMLTRPQMVNDIPRSELNKVYGALSDDLRGSLTEQPDALKAFNTATNNYKEGINQIHSYIEPLVNSGNGIGGVGNIADRLVNLVQKNPQAVSAVRKAVTPEQWDDVAASIFHGLGRASPGDQGATASGFSIPKFLTDFNKLRQEPKAFNMAFGDTRYAQLRDTYGDLAQIADSIKQASRLANPSRSGYTTGGIALAASMLTSPFTAAKAIGGNFAFAQAMSHPQFAQWLVKIGRIVRQGQQRNGQAADLLLRAQIAKLPAMAAANSQIKPALDGVYSYLMGGTPQQGNQ